MNTYTKEQRVAHLRERFDNSAKTIYANGQPEITWEIIYCEEKFVAYTDFGTYTHYYDWDYSYDANLETFVEDVKDFVQKESDKRNTDIQEVKSIIPILEGYKSHLEIWEVEDEDNSKEARKLIEAVRLIISSINSIQEN